MTEWPEPPRGPLSIPRLLLVLAFIVFLIAYFTRPSWSAEAVAIGSVPYCSGPVRETCVVDGDTIWWRGEKIRLAAIDAPEVNGRCHAARILAANAAERLRQLLEAGAVTIEREGEDRYGRTLARIVTVEGLAGDVLIAEKLARPWAGRRERWCGR